MNTSSYSLSTQPCTYSSPVSFNIQLVDLHIWWNIANPLKHKWLHSICDFTRIWESPWRLETNYPQQRPQQLTVNCLFLAINTLCISVSAHWLYIMEFELHCISYNIGSVKCVHKWFFDVDLKGEATNVIVHRENISNFYSVDIISSITHYST